MNHMFDTNNNNNKPRFAISTFLIILALVGTFLLLVISSNGNNNSSKDSLLSKTNPKKIIINNAPLSLQNQKDRDTLMTMDIATSFQFQRQAIPEIFELHEEPNPTTTRVVEETSPSTTASHDDNAIHQITIRKFCEPFSRRSQSRRNSLLCNTATNLHAVNTKLVDTAEDDRNTFQCIAQEKEVLNKVEKILSRTELGQCALRKWKRNAAGSSSSSSFTSTPNTTTSVSTSINRSVVIIVAFHLTRNANTENINELRKGLRELISSFGKLSGREAHPHHHQSNSSSSSVLHILFDDETELAVIESMLERRRDSSSMSSLVLTAVKLKKVEAALIEKYSPTNARIFYFHEYLLNSGYFMKAQSDEHDYHHRNENQIILTIDTRDAQFQKEGGDLVKKLHKLVASLLSNSGKSNNNNDDLVFAISEDFPLVAAGHTRMWIEKIMMGVTTTSSMETNNNNNAFESLVLKNNSSSSSFRLLPDGALLPVINSGIYGASSLSAMMQLLQMMKIVFECSSILALTMTTNKQHQQQSKTLGAVFGMDQGVMNLIAYFGIPFLHLQQQRRKPRLAKDSHHHHLIDFFILNHRTTDLATHFVVGGENRKSDRGNLKRNCIGEPYSIIHQFDRYR